MTKHEQKVSVIIPTFGRDSYFLLRAIESIKNQTYKNIEVIIVDDNSPNSDYRLTTEKTMKKFNSDSSVIYYRNDKNMGGSEARNNGIGIATGDFITFLDDDDEYLSSKVENQLKFMLHTDCDMSFTNLKLVNDNHEIVDYREYHKLKAFDKNSLLKYHIMRHLTGTPTFMYKTKKLIEIGGFKNVKMGQEFYLMLKSIEGNLKIRYFNECGVIAYRHKEGGISQGKNKLVGERELYNFKKSYFDLFSVRERMFIRFRHNAVMLIAYKRNKNYLKSFLRGIMMFISSPIDFIVELFQFIINIFRNRNL